MGTERQTDRAIEDGGIRTIRNETVRVNPICRVPVIPIESLLVAHMPSALPTPGVFVATFPHLAMWATNMPSAPQTEKKRPRHFTDEAFFGYETS